MLHPDFCIPPVRSCFFLFSLFILSLLSLPQVAAQEQNDITHKITVGTYYSSGDYGVDEDTEISYIPISYELARFPWVLSVTVPYLSLQGPGDVFLETGNIGRPRGTTSEMIDEKGLGDVFLTATYQLPPIFNDWVFLDLTVQTKLPTADENNDLGTGKSDTGLQLDFYTSLERNTYFTTVGYRHRGKTPLYDLENSFYATLGLMRQYSDKTFLGLLYDYREKASSNGFESHELMPFLSYNLDSQWNVMLYSIFGFTNSSADNTIGFQISYTLP